MRYTSNLVTLNGYLYALGDEKGKQVLSQKVSGPESSNPGTPYIAGTIQIAVDENGLNVLPVHFTYVTETTSKGNVNPNYLILNDIIQGKHKTWVKDGKENALKLRVDTAFALNDFYVTDKQTNEEVLRSPIIQEGGLITITDMLLPEDERNIFCCDMLISKVTHVDADGEKVTEDYDTVRGAIFNYKKEILPVTFTLRDPVGMAHFEAVDLDSEPMYIRVWGAINNLTTKTTTTQETAFGKPVVHTYEKKTKDWTITSAARAPYEYGEDITAEEITKALQDREIKLAEDKKRNEEWRAKRNTANATSAVPEVKHGGFSF